MMIALASSNQSSALQNYFFDDTDTSGQSDQSDDQSDGQQGDQVAMVDVFVVQKRFALPAPPQCEKPSEIARAMSDKPALAKFPLAVPFLIPTRLFIARSGLLPRAPSIA